MPQPQKVRWRKTDGSVRLAYCQEHEELQLIYGRIYTPGMGFAYSETNQFINNLKILKSADQNRLYYKEQAIKRFAAEVCSLLQVFAFPITLVPIPPSKTSAHPDYDDRVDQVARLIAERLAYVQYLPILYRTVDTESHHASRRGRDPERIYRDISINESFAASYDGESLITLLDDVLTSGAHYSACRRRLCDRFKDEEVAGIFWAKAQYPDDFYSEFSD